MRAAIVLIATLLFSLQVNASEPSYPRGQLLIEPAQLAAAIGDRMFVVLDARPEEEYAKSHIPGALSIDAGQWKKAFGAGTETAEWAERIGRLGITPQAKVVIYDDSSAKDAARIWWILRYWGVEDARLLNGGWTGWRAADAPTQQETPEPPKAVSFEAEPEAQRLATRASILESLATRSMQIVDARSEAEFCGIESLSNQRAGAIPGAKHLEWTDLIDPATQRFKPAAELQRLFHDAGIDLEKPLATHCQSGGRSSVMAFGLELMGATGVQNYYAGWNEWGNTEETPVVKPEPPKE